MVPVSPKQHHVLSLSLSYHAALGSRPGGQTAPELWGDECVCVRGGTVVGGENTGPRRCGVCVGRCPTLPAHTPATAGMSVTVCPVRPHSRPVLA